MTQPVTFFDLARDGCRPFRARSCGGPLGSHPALGCVFREAVVECKMFRSPLKTIKVGYVEALMRLPEPVIR
jgi:hypothetical protein